MLGLLEPRRMYLLRLLLDWSLSSLQFLFSCTGSLDGASILQDAEKETDLFLGNFSIGLRREVEELRVGLEAVIVKSIKEVLLNVTFGLQR
jgi:hypothetical protein